MGLTLAIRNLTVRKSGYTLLDDISFSVRSGEFVAIVGPNGAGKTTLLRAIAGERPYCGSVCIRDEGEHSFLDLYDDPERWFRRIGQVPVDNVLHDRLPVRKALIYAGRLHGIPEKELVEKINDLLEEFDIARIGDSLIYQLSSGERKRVNICAELLTEPGLLLLDEPTTNLDPDAENELMKMLSERSKQGTTVMVVSHTTNSLRCCNRVILVANSEIIQVLDQQQISKKEPDWWVGVFEDHRTGPRRPTRNPPKKSVSCGNGRRVSWSEAQPNGAIRTAPRHYWLLLIRQLALLYYEGWRIPVRQTWERIKTLIYYDVWSVPVQKAWEGVSTFLFGDYAADSQKAPKRSLLDWNWMVPLPLMVALAFGPLTGVLLASVLPDEAFIQSANKMTGLDAGDASQAAFLVGLVSFLIGLLGSFREVVREIHIYQHERLKGLRPRVYLSARFTILGVLYGIVAPVLMFLVLRSYQEFPSKGLIFGSGSNVLFTILLTSLAGVALGLAISSVGSSGEWATILMGTSVIVNALLSGLVKNEAFEKVIDIVSVFVPSRWAMEGLKTTTGLYCWGVQQVLRDHFSPSHFLSVWMALLTYALASLALAYLALHLKDVWFKPLRRLRPLISKRNYVYIITLLIIMISSAILYEWAGKFHNAELLVGQIDELSGGLRATGFLSAAWCEDEPTPSLLVVEVRTPVPPLLSTPVPMATATPISQAEQASPSPKATNTPTTQIVRTSSPTSLPTDTPVVAVEPTATPSPTYSVPDEPTAVTSEPIDLYFGPTTDRGKWMASLPAGSTLVLLSYSAHNGYPWLRVQSSAGMGLSYVGWVNASSPPLSEHVWKVNLERKTPPECARPLAGTHFNMKDVDTASGKLGAWVSDGKAEVAVVVDLYREEAGVSSDPLSLHLKLNGKDLRPITVESQQKRFILHNGVYNVQVKSGDQLVIELTPYSSNTLKTLYSHVSIFLVPPDNCEFHER